MQHGHLILPRGDFDYRGCTQHITEPRDPWWWHHQRTPDLLDMPAYEARGRYQKPNRHTGLYGVERYRWHDGRGRLCVKFRYKQENYWVGIFTDAREAAVAHDDYCRAHGIERILNCDEGLIP